MAQATDAGQLGRAFVELLGTLRIDAVDEQWVVEGVIQSASSRKGWITTYAHAQTLLRSWQDERFARSLAFADLCYADGMGVVLASGILGCWELRKTTANRFFPELCRRATALGMSLALLGGRRGVAQRTAQRIDGWCQGRARVWASQGDLSGEQESAAIRQMAEFGPNIVFVGLGQPRQEELAVELLRRLPSTTIMCVGGLFEVMSGEDSVCPPWLQRWGMEWTFRLVHEPRRVWRRYLLGLPALLAIVLWYRATGHRAQQGQRTHRPPEPQAEHALLGLRKLT
jgi:N-acetylglucosaminyldiphosphoundecaprenol N-acetyl-beta-D-mannosaminyltransferase